MPDVIIVGGGPIGSIAGILLARKGVDVLIIEKQKHPRWKPCGEGISKEGVNILRRYNLFSPVQNLFKDINGISFNIFDNNIVSYERDVPLAYTLDRTKFDHALISYAQDMGAQIHQSERVKNVKNLEKIQVETRHNTYNSKILIGADGVFSIVGKKLYRKWAHNEIGFAEVARFKLKHLPQTVKVDVMEYYLIRGGYGWIFPRMEDEYLVLNIGIAKRDNKKIGHLFNWFIATLESIKGMKLKGHEIDGKIWRHSIPEKGPCRGTYTNSTLLIGDAGGFVNPLTGGGLKYGTYSAIYASETIVKFLNNEIESLSLYKDKWQKNIKPVFNKSLKVREKIYFIPPMQLLTEMQKHPKMKEQLFQFFVGKTNRR
jgi:geranylgeranyl reductase family protein